MDASQKHDIGRIVIYGRVGTRYVIYMENGKIMVIIRNQGGSHVEEFTQADYNRLMTLTHG